MSNPLEMPKCRTMASSLLILAAIILLIFKGIPLVFKPSILKQIQDSGELVIISRNSPTTYYEGPEGPTGFEYELAKKFADSLGVALKVITPDNLNDIFDMLDNGQAHFAAAGLTVTESRKERVKFAASYQEITEQLVYHNQDITPDNIDDLALGNLEVIAGSSHVESLEQLKQTNPALEWIEHDDIESEQLLQLVNDRIVDYTVADSNEVAMNQRFLLELRVAFDISNPKKLAWAFPKSKDTSLYDRAMVFFWRHLNNGDITQLIERHFGHVSKFDYVGNRIYIRHIATRLSKYQDMYIEAGDKYDIDWRLLAAMGYQESHWNPKAVSPTGVRGIMMLTRETAGQLGIKNRLDPESSIFGGAKYLAQIRNRLPEEITEPDRTWFALASYNVGYYHLEDARQIATSLEKDSTKWIDLKTTLPLLSRKQWYKKTSYGYARGWEPVRYVEAIRRYYDLLNYQLAKSNPKSKPEHDAFSILPPVL
ncbi:MAG: membrane-bound lytic murein transglycosylase MltF [Gammaproteobacteria bacterium]|nr:membrane-bound lytic murein transglycosylase MltF [Gammaproteobacteria bacterium]